MRVVPDNCEQCKRLEAEEIESRKRQIELLQEAHNALTLKVSGVEIGPRVPTGEGE